METSVYLRSGAFHLPGDCMLRARKMASPLHGDDGSGAAAWMTRDAPTRKHSMVDLTLTEEQLSMRAMAHDFAAKEIRPVAWEYDKDGTWPQGIIEKAWELGLMNAQIPEIYGGPGATYFEGCLIWEELAWGPVQVYGGYGFMRDYPVEKLMRDAKIMQLYEGTSRIQRLVIARETLLPRCIDEPVAA